MLGLNAMEWAGWDSLSLAIRVLLRLLKSVIIKSGHARSPAENVQQSQSLRVVRDSWFSLSRPKLPEGQHRNVESSSS